MENTLVTHKKKNLGIGCIARELKNSYKVNFGTDDVVTCKKDDVEVIDTSKCKTIGFRDFQRSTFTNNVSEEYVIVGNELKHYVGIGWITVRAITFDDLKKYKRVI